MGAGNNVFCMHNNYSSTSTQVLVWHEIDYFACYILDLLKNYYEVIIKLYHSADSIFTTHLSQVVLKFHVDLKYRILRRNKLFWVKTKRCTKVFDFFVRFNIRSILKCRILLWFTYVESLWLRFTYVELWLGFTYRGIIPLFSLEQLR